MGGAESARPVTHIGPAFGAVARLAPPLHQKTNCGILLRGVGAVAARVLSRISARSNHNRCATKRLKRISPAEKEICI